jgi:hypothetical protein
LVVLVEPGSVELMTVIVRKGPKNIVYLQKLLSISFAIIRN